MGPEFSECAAVSQALEASGLLVHNVLIILPQKLESYVFYLDLMESTVPVFPFVTGDESMSQKLRPVDWIIYCTKSLEMSRWLIKPQITTDISTREELRLPVLKSRPETFTPERLQMAVLSHIPSCPLG